MCMYLYIICDFPYFSLPFCCIKHIMFYNVICNIVVVYLYYCDLLMNVIQKLLVLKDWSPAGDIVSGSSGRFRRQEVAGESRSLTCGCVLSLAVAWLTLLLDWYEWSSSHPLPSPSPAMLSCEVPNGWWTDPLEVERNKTFHPLSCPLWYFSHTSKRSNQYR